MTSTIKVNNIQNQCGQNIINENSNTITIGASGDTISLASGASQTGFGRTGTVDWQTTPKTGDFTAVNGEGYFVNTTSGVITMTMPSGSAGAIVSIQDYNKTFDDNTFTVTPASGEKINGGSVDGSLVIGTEGQGLTFVYVDATVGWKTVHENEFLTGGSSHMVATGGTETTSGDFKIHTFTGPGTFTVNQLSPTAAENTVSYLVVAGGGGGASGYQTGGAGAGGFREYRAPVSGCYAVSPLNGNPGGTAITVTATSFPITVGGGGAAGPSSPSEGSKGGNGNPSVFSTVTSTAGGGGGAYNPVCGPIQCGEAGGSGGGAGRRNATKSGGAGNSPPVSPSQGFPGGPTAPPYGHPYSGGGGGGATAQGQGVSGSGVGTGGAGATTSINGTPTAYAGGGGGGGYGSPAPSSDSGDSGAGGAGGGGRGGYGGSGQPTSGGVNGTDNTGGGAGSSAFSGSLGGNGGSGIVIIRYKFQ